MDIKELTKPSNGVHKVEEPNKVITFPKTKDFPDIQSGTYVKVTADRGADDKPAVYIGWLWITSKPHRPLEFELIWPSQQTNSYGSTPWYDKKKNSHQETNHHTFTQGNVISIEILPKPNDHICFPTSSDYNGMYRMGDTKVSIGCQLIEQDVVRMILANMDAPLPNNLKIHKEMAGYLKDEPKKAAIKKASRSRAKAVEDDVPPISNGWENHVNNPDHPDYSEDWTFIETCECDECNEHRADED
jgi:hypothetical protein